MKKQCYILLVISSLLGSCSLPPSASTVPNQNEQQTEKKPLPPGHDSSFDANYTLRGNVTKVTEYKDLSGQTIIHNRNKIERSRGLKKFHYFQFLESDRWVAADLINLWKTNDGGATWMLSYSPMPEANISQYIRGISFIDAQTGFLIDRQKLLRTEDGGIKWHEVGSLQLDEEAGFIQSCYFVNSLRGWAVGLNWSQDFLVNPGAPQFVGIVLTTYDGGKTWQKQLLDLPEGYFEVGTSWGLNNVFFIDDRIGWVVGDGVIFRTINGGVNWQLCNVNKKYRGDYTQVMFIDEKHGWVIMRNNSVQRKLNSLNRWLACHIL